MNSNDDAHALAAEVPVLIDEIKGLKESYDEERRTAAKQRRDDKRRRWANRVLGGLLALALAGILAILVQEQLEVERDKDDRDNARQLIQDSKRTLETLLAYQDPNSEVVKKSQRDQAAVITGLVTAIRTGFREDLAAAIRCEEVTVGEPELLACLLENLPLDPLPSPTPTPED